MAGPFDLGPAVDVHHHWLPREIADHVADYLPEGYTVREDGPIRHIRDPQGQRVQSVNVETFPDIDRRLELMDAAGIQLALLSPGCFPQWMTMKAARVINDAAAGLAREHGDRFRPMINVPPFGELGILEEMERAAKMGLRGVCITTNFGGLYPDEDAYQPFLHKAAELDLPVFIHAAGAPVEYAVMRKYDLTTPMGRSLDLCLTPVRLICSGAFENIPGLKVVIAHLGGFVFANLDRWFGPPTTETARYPLDKAQQAMDQMLFDSAPAGWYSAAEIQYAIDRLGPSRVTLGSDYPHGADSLRHATDSICALNLSQEDKRQIAGANARRLYAL
ncbi:MAG TPA: amidohydrolase family protein [Chloroflexota bacterium]|nr:amidohydrolase family protein [Chloroflexota bacterium]